MFDFYFTYNNGTWNEFQLPRKSKYYWYVSCAVIVRRCMISPTLLIDCMYVEFEYFFHGFKARQKTIKLSKRRLALIIYVHTNIMYF